MSPTLAGGFFITEPSGKPLFLHWDHQTIWLISKSSARFKVKGEGEVKSLSRVRLFATPWAVTY